MALHPATYFRLFALSSLIQRLGFGRMVFAQLVMRVHREHDMFRRIKQKTRLDSLGKHSSPGGFRMENIFVDLHTDADFLVLMSDDVKLTLCTFIVAGEAQEFKKKCS